MQRDKHNLVKVTRRLNEFTWTMSKLRFIIKNSLDEDDGQVKRCFKTFCSKVENDGDFCYQGIKLAKYCSNQILQSSGQKLFMPVQYWTFALKLNKGFFRLWSLLHFQTFYYYLTLNHGQKMTSLALAIARSTSWLNII